MTTATVTWTRLTRALGSDHNPLRRRSDLMAAWLAPAAIAVFLVLGPLVAGGAVVWAHAGNAAARRAGRELHAVPAVLLAAVPGPLMSASGANSWLTWAPARWVAGGQAQAGRIPAVSGSPAGSTVPVWLNRAGHVMTPPLTASQARDRVIIAAAAALAVPADRPGPGRPLRAEPAAPGRLGGGLAADRPALEPPGLRRLSQLMIATVYPPASAGKVVAIKESARPARPPAAAGRPGTMWPWSPAIPVRARSGSPPGWSCSTPTTACC